MLCSPAVLISNCAGWPPAVIFWAFETKPVVRSDKKINKVEKRIFCFLN
jgi:hypothetical protein